MEIQILYSQLDQSRLALSNDGVEVVGGKFEHVGRQRSADGQHRRQESSKPHNARYDENDGGDESGERKGS